MILLTPVVTFIEAERKVVPGFGWGEVGRDRNFVYNGYLVLNLEGEKVLEVEVAQRCKRT